MGGRELNNNDGAIHDNRNAQPDMKTEEKRERSEIEIYARLTMINLALPI